MVTFFDKHRVCLSNKSFVLSTITGFVLLIVSLIINYYAGLYATEKASLAVTDIILSNIPVFNVDEIFIYGPFVLWAFVIILSIVKPQRIPFILKNIALFILIRSVFITLTHIGPFPNALPLDSDLLKNFSSGSDLFFLPRNSGSSFYKFACTQHLLLLHMIEESGRFLTRNNQNFVRQTR